MHLDSFGLVALQNMFRPVGSFGGGVATIQKRMKYIRLTSMIHDVLL